MTELRQRMLDAMVQRGFALRTQDAYVRAIRRMAKHYRRDPAQYSRCMCCPPGSSALGTMDCWLPAKPSHWRTRVNKCRCRKATQWHWSWHRTSCAGWLGWTCTSVLAASLVGCAWWKLSGVARPYRRRGRTTRSRRNAPCALRSRLASCNQRHDSTASVGGLVGPMTRATSTTVNP